MRTTLGRTAVALGFIGTMAIGTMVPVMAQGVYLNSPGVHVGGGHRHYYNYYGGGRRNTYHGCRRGWTSRGGVCRPYRRGPGYGPVDLR